MKGNASVIKALNSILSGELTAINQYFLHARMCAAWGYQRIADQVRKESIDEMKHAQTIIDRILFLEGIPNVQKMGVVNIGETVPEQLAADLKLEYEAIPRLKEGINLCTKANDHATRDILEKILLDEETHTDWIETQLEQIKQLGVENYLAVQIKA